MDQQTYIQRQPWIHPLFGLWIWSARSDSLLSILTSVQYIMYMLDVHAIIKWVLHSPRLISIDPLHYPEHWNRYSDISVTYSHSLMKAAVGCQNVWITVSVFWLVQQIDWELSSWRHIVCTTCRAKASTVSVCFISYFFISFCFPSLCCEWDLCFPPRVQP